MRLLVLLLLCSACFTRPGLHVASTPPGAAVHVDGQDSGFVTPCELALEYGDPYAVELRLPGHAPARVQVEPLSRTLGVRYWQEASNPPARPHWHFPLFLTSFDFFVPRYVQRAHSPARIHLRLKPDGRP